MTCSLIKSGTTAVPVYDILGIFVGSRSVEKPVGPVFLTLRTVNII